MHAASQLQLHTDDLIAIFDHCFAKSFNTRLVGGASEPIYLPANGHIDHHRVYFTRDYFASALHEVAHWCIAGDRRRTMTDYGYWYAPDGRSPAQQQEFEQVEVKPQALEWLFSEACGASFSVSADNLSEGLGASQKFKADIARQAQIFCKQGLPPRPLRFLTALAEHYGVTDPLNCAHYSYERLR